MKTFIKRFKSSGRISHVLRVCKLITGKYGIETKIASDRKGNTFVLNINLPLFDTEEEAYSYLEKNYEKE